MTPTEYRYDLFISYAEADQAWVKGYLLKALGLPPKRVVRRTGFRPGAAVVGEFERAVTGSRYTLLVLSPAYLADEWATFGELLAQHATVAERRERLVPLLLKECELPLRVDFRVRLDCTEKANWKGEAARLRELLDQPEPAEETIPCPYPGMKPFEEADAGRFFGRDKEVQELLQRLRKYPFLAVIGPSGSGKSSLVFAGLVPKLRESGLFGGGSWQVIALRPGQRPAESLAATIKGDVNQPAKAVSALLSSQPGARRLLLLVDQFEELFTQAEEGEVVPFQEALLRLTETAGCYVVLTVRADFYGELMTSLLWRQIQRHRAEVLPLDEEGLRQAIVRPAERSGVFVDPFLVEGLVSDAAGEPGLLPFVQETLVLLWEKLERRYLPLSAYDEMSDLRAAMAQHAESVLDALTAEEEAIARRTLLRLVQFGEGRADTRRQQTVAELGSAGDDAALLHRTLAHLAENRLITFGGAEKGEKRWVDLAHEALIEGWPTLHGWVRERRDAEQTRRRLESKAGEWVRLGKQKGGLLDTVELIEADRWLASPDADVLGYSDLVAELVQASRVALDEAATEREAAQRAYEQALERLAQTESQLEQARRENEAAQRALDQAQKRVVVAGIGIASEQVQKALEELGQYNEALGEWTELSDRLRRTVDDTEFLADELERLLGETPEGGGVSDRARHMVRLWWRSGRAVEDLRNLAEHLKHVGGDKVPQAEISALQDSITLNIEALRVGGDREMLYHLNDDVRQLLYVLRKVSIIASMQIRELSNRVSQVLGERTLD